MHNIKGDCLILYMNLLNTHARSLLTLLISRFNQKTINILLITNSKLLSVIVFPQ